MRRRRVLILGAAGRDFHNFNVLFRDREEFEVIGFTAAQIPDIAGRTYPPELAGRLYPKGIPIVAEEELEQLVAAESVDEAWFSYSDLAHDDVMHLASRAIAAGAHFVLAAAQRTMLTSVKPVIAITAVRTGVGKTQTTRYVSKILKAMGKRWSRCAIRCPTATCAKQICQRFADLADLDKHECTIEEREEYEPHIDQGNVVYAGVDYEKILRAAEDEADVILWDGGNNDTAVLHARPAHRRGRSAPARARGDVPSRRDERAHGRRRRDQQGEHGRSGEGRPRSRRHAGRSTPRATILRCIVRDLASTIRRRSAASGCWSSRTDRR